MSTGNNMKRIAILEDDESISKFITAGLRAEAYHVECFSLVDELITFLQDNKFDVLIMDRMLEQEDSLRWMNTVKLLVPDIRIIVLSALSGSIHRIKGLECGADDYLEKPFQYNELSLRIKKLMNKDSHTREAIIQFDDITFNLDSQKMQRAGQFIDLSPYEYKMMVIFVKEPTKIHSRTKLLDAVWGYNYDTSSNVVDVAIGKLRKKINLATCQPLIFSSRGRGYMLSK